MPIASLITYPISVPPAVGSGRTAPVSSLVVEIVNRRWSVGIW